MDKYARILNNFVHDTATGMWVACVMVVWILAGRLPDMPGPAAASLGDAMRACLWLAVASLVVIGATGGFRMRYWRREASPDELEQKRRSLIVKHVILILIYVPGTFWAWSLLP